MRRIAIALAAIGLLASPAMAKREKQTPEQELAKLLEGREAGKPVSCISTFGSRSIQIFDKTALVYDAGSVIYVNRPKNPGSLDDDDVLVTRQHGSQLCRLDMVSLHERTGMWYRGFVALEDFVPYRKVAKAD
jgi:hypothetical protein